jgi:hypothetical protein
MTEHASTATEVEVIPFSPEDLKQFDSEDAQAGRAIGKMLSLFFLYTVLAMSVAAFVTYWWITNPQVH